MPPMEMTMRYSFIDKIAEEALEAYFEKKIKDKHKNDKKPSSPKSGLGFFEGLVVAYIAQVMYGPLTKLLEVYLQAHGVH